MRCAAVVLVAMASAVTGSGSLPNGLVPPGSASSSGATSGFYNLGVGRDAAHLGLRRDVLPLAGGSGGRGLPGGERACEHAAGDDRGAHGPTDYDVSDETLPSVTGEEEDTEALLVEALGARPEVASMAQAVRPRS